MKNERMRHHCFPCNYMYQETDFFFKKSHMVEINNEMHLIKFQHTKAHQSHLQAESGQESKVREKNANASESLPENHSLVTISLILCQLVYISQTSVFSSALVEERCTGDKQIGNTSVIQRILKCHPQVNKKEILPVN